MTDAQAIADRVLRAYDGHAELWIEPATRDAVMLPTLVLSELGLPDGLFDKVAAVWDCQLRRALAETVAQAADLATVK